MKSPSDLCPEAGKSGQPGNIDGEDLRPLENALKGLCLAGLSARKTVAVSVDFSGCQLQAAKFDDADLRAACFSDTNLSGISFNRAKLAHASFHKAQIDDLTLHNGEVLHAKAERAEAVVEQFGTAQIGAAVFILGINARLG